MSLSETTLDTRIASRIRGLRTAASLTLEGLAERAGVSRAMLSRIERGEASPTAHLLNRVCGGLGITLSALFAEASAPGVPLARLAEQPVWRDPASQYLRRQVSPAGTGSPVEIAAIEFPAGASVTFDNAFPGPWLGDADQHVWVLAGQLLLSVGDVTHALAAGDCLFMRFGPPVRFYNPGQDATRYAVIVSRGAAQP